MGVAVRLRASLGLIGLVLLTAVGCSNKPTYPKAELAESFQQVFQEHRLEATTTIVDHTLGVQVAFPDALQQTADHRIELGPKFQDAAREILTAIHRVLLSTDAEIEFYVVLLSDPKTPGAYLTMVRYMDDVRRASVNIIDPPEMFARTVFELSVSSPRPITIEEYLPREIQMGEFLSWQLARRIQQALGEEIGRPGLAFVGHCGGRFEAGEFLFTLDISPLTTTPLDEQTIQEVFHVSTSVIARVLSSYRFEEFDTVRLTHPLTGRSLVLPKHHLSVFR